MMSFYQCAIIVFYLILIIMFLNYAYSYPSKIFSRAELDEFNNIITHFYKHPNADDFNDIYNNRDGLIIESGNPIKFWLWGVQTAHPDFLSSRQHAVVNKYHNDISRTFRRIEYAPIALYIDCLWAAYFATGDVQYSNAVKNLCTHTTTTIAKSAIWSYRNIMKINPLTNEPINETDLVHDYFAWGDIMPVIHNEWVDMARTYDDANDDANAVPVAMEAH